jgi:hypothetical protein
VSGAVQGELEPRTRVQKIEIVSVLIAAGDDDSIEVIEASSQNAA